MRVPESWPLVGSLRFGVSTLCEARGREGSALSTSTMVHSMGRGMMLEPWPLEMGTHCLHPEAARVSHAHRLSAPLQSWSSGV